MKIVTLIALALVGCGGPARTPARGSGTADRGGEEAIGLGAPGGCFERYDDASAEQASAADVAMLETLIAAARVGDRRALAIAIDRGLDGDGIRGGGDGGGGGDDRAPSVAAAERAAALEALLTSLPAACAPVWYTQPGRFAVQPRLEGEPVDERRNALANALEDADHLVATCDGGCAVIAVALVPGSGLVVDWGSIVQRPGNAH